MRVYSRGVVESAVALSENFHQDKRYRWVYDTYGYDLGGFPGVYDLIIEAAMALEKAKPKSEEWGDDYDWILSVEDLSDNLHKFIRKEGIPEKKQLLQIAKESLHE
jgi:hypothetical protein